MSIRPRHTAKNVSRDNRSSWTIAIGLLLVVIGVLFILYYFENSRPKPEEYFIKYDDATMLVVIQYGERLFLLGYKEAAGFINADVYESYKNNEYDEATITVYHPYLTGESTDVNTDSIVTITVKTYENFYNNYSPDI